MNFIKIALALLALASPFLLADWLITKVFD